MLSMLVKISADGTWKYFYMYLIFPLKLGVDISFKSSPNYKTTM